MLIDRHERDDTPEGPLFFCIELDPNDLTTLELERRAVLIEREEVRAMVARMERADPRDRWRHMGAAPTMPAPEVRDGPMVAAPPRAPEPFHPLQVTVDAFWFVVSLKDTDKLSAWLRDHPRDTSFLLKLLEAK